MWEILLGIYIGVAVISYLIMQTFNGFLGAKLAKGEIILLIAVCWPFLIFYVLYERSRFSKKGK